MLEDLSFSNHILSFIFVLNLSSLGGLSGASLATSASLKEAPYRQFCSCLNIVSDLTEVHV